MKISDTFNLLIRRQKTDGTAPSGLVAGDFLLDYRVNGVAAAVAITVTEGAVIGPTGDQWREYRLTFGAPGTIGGHVLTALPASGTDRIWNPCPFETFLTAYDIDAIAGIVVQPVLTLSDQGGPTGDIALRLPKGDFAPITMAISDAAGNPMDLTSWTNGRFGVENEGQTLAYVQTATLGNGTASWNVPETAAFYNELTAGQSSVALHWTLVGDEAGDTTKTRTLARGQLSVIRREVAT